MHYERYHLWNGWGELSGYGPVKANYFDGGTRRLAQSAFKLN